MRCGSRWSASEKFSLPSFHLGELFAVVPAEYGEVATFQKRIPGLDVECQRFPNRQLVFADAIINQLAAKRHDRMPGIKIFSGLDQLDELFRFLRIFLQKEVETESHMGLHEMMRAAFRNRCGMFKQIPVLVIIRFQNRITGFRLCRT